jgi:hypothetical protein
MGAADWRDRVGATDDAIPCVKDQDVSTTTLRIAESAAAADSVAHRLQRDVGSAP